MYLDRRTTRRKTKLPPDLAPMLEGGSPDVSNVGGLLGGLFGGQPE
jgi:hypothetical protein